MQNQHIQIQKNIPNEDNPDITEKYVTTNIWGNAECVGEKCGAWFGGVDIMNNNNKLLFSFLIEIIAIILTITSAFLPFVLYVKLNIIAIYMYFLSDTIIEIDFKKKRKW